MIKLTQTDDMDLVNEILSHPGLPRACLAQLEDGNLTSTCTHLLVHNEEGVLVGLMSCREVNSIIIEAHTTVLPEFWGTGIGDELGYAFRDELLAVTKYRHILTYVPNTEKHVINYLYSKDFKLVGSIPRGTEVNGQKVTLLIFNLEIKRA